MHFFEDDTWSSNIFCIKTGLSLHFIFHDSLEICSCAFSFLRFFLGELWLSGHNRGKFSRLWFPWRWIQLTGKTRVSKTACTTCETPGREEPSNNYLGFRVSETIRGALCTVYLHHLNAGQLKSLLLKYSYSSKQPTHREPSYSQF